MNRGEIVKLREKILSAETWQQAVLSCAEENAPGQIVCECDGQEITFEEFETTTNHIAAVLQRRGLYAGKTIALRMSRSEKMFLALYGVVKSGAALLPIPKEMPPKSVEDIYGQISVDYTVTDEEYDALCQEKICMDETPVNFAKMAEAEDNALILFTSGSNGRPKGVLHSQKSALYFTIQFMIDMRLVGIDYGEMNCIIAKTNINYMSTYLFEMPLPLFYGKKAVILTEKEQNDAGVLGSKFTECRNAGIFLTPSQVDNYLKSEKFCRQFQALKVLILAGEHTTKAVLRHILDRANAEMSVLNVYGSTECGVIGCQNERREDADNLVILPDTEIVFVNENGQQAAEGMQGELTICSPHQFKSYVNAESRNIRRDNEAYFCTGDIGRQTASGSFTIRGRRDRMVKYHGMRVELESIECNICRFPGIEECAVVINKTEKGSEVLSAYYVCRENKKIDRRKLRRFLEDYLPVNVIPVGMIQMESLPLNANGKRDNKKLESLLYVPDELHNGTAEAANSENVQLLCKIVSSLTEVCALPEDDLFSLGMDSLMAFRIISELREAGWSVTIGEIFANPVICDLAGFLEKSEENTEPEAASAARDRYSATGIQIYWGTNIDFNKKMRGLYVTEDFLSSVIYTEEEFRNRIEILLKRHPALRSHIAFENGAPVQTISEMEEVSFASLKEAQKGLGSQNGKNTFCLVDYIDLRGLEDKRKEASDAGEDLNAAQIEYIENFKKELMGCLARSEKVYAFEAAYFQISNTRSAIVFTGNHASMDGTSMNILMQELICRELAEKEDCYRQFLTYIEKRENIERAIGFYTEYLKDAVFSTLPKVEPKENYQPAFNGRTISLGKAGTEKIYAQSKEERVSPIGYIMYLYGQGLLETLNKDALIMQILTFGRGVPVSGMDQAVGCFIEYIPVVIRKGDTVNQFQEGNLLAEQNSFAPLPVIWKQTYHLDEPPTLAPFLISEVFPEITTDGFIRKLSELDYERMFMGNFIARKDGELRLYFHYDAARLEEKTFCSVLDVMSRRLEENGFIRP